MVIMAEANKTTFRQFAEHGGANCSKKSGSKGGSTLRLQLKEDRKALTQWKEVKINCWTTVIPERSANEIRQRIQWKISFWLKRRTQRLQTIKIFKLTFRRLTFYFLVSNGGAWTTVLGNDVHHCVSFPTLCFSVKTMNFTPLLRGCWREVTNYLIWGNSKCDLEFHFFLREFSI